MESELIDKIKKLKDDILDLDKRIALIRRCQNARFYSSPAIEFSFTETGRASNDLKINIGYMNTQSWVTYHLQQEMNLCIAKKHKTETFLLNYVKKLNESLAATLA